MIAGAPGGHDASSFTSVSLDPPLVSVGVAIHRRPAEAGRASDTRLVGSVVGPRNVARRLSAEGGDRFAEVDWGSKPRPVPSSFTAPRSGWSCKPFKTVDAGDHEIVVLAIEALLMNPDVDPMIFHRSGFHEILRSA